MKKTHLPNDSWLKDVSAETKELVFSNCKSKSYVKGEYVHHAGGEAKELFFIEKGTVRINKVSEEGKELLITHLNTGDWFGFIGTFGSGYRPNDAIAQLDTTILYLPQTDLNNIIQKEPIIALKIAHFLASYVEYYNAVYECSVFMSLSERLHLLLDRLAISQQNNTVAISQNDLAAMLGVTKEAIGINLNVLKSVGVLDLGYRKIRLKSHSSNHSETL